MIAPFRHVPDYSPSVARLALGLLTWVLIVVCVLCLVTAQARSDDRTDRDRKARAVLALSAPRGGPATAPAPRPAPKDYATGHKESSLDGKPLVVFVGCQARQVPGAVVSRVMADTFGDTRAPAVVVGYPRGDRLYIESTLRGPATDAEINKAVESAAKKIDTPPTKPMPAAPKPLDWRL